MSFPMRTFLHKLAQRLHAIEDHLTVRVQIAAAVAAMSVVLIGTLATGAAFISYRNTSALVKSNLASIAAAASGRLDRFMAVRQQELDMLSKLRPLEKLWQNDPVELRHANHTASTNAGILGANLKPNPTMSA